MKAYTQETQAQVSPDQSVQLLLEGNERFVNNNPVSRDLLDQVNDTSGGQYPISAVLSCIDSRIPTEIIFDQGIGDIFNARVAGNFINEDILGSLEFACKVAGAKSIVVMGHTSCGAVKGAIAEVELGNLTQMIEKITPSVNSVKDGNNGEETADFVNDVARDNVRRNIAVLREKSPVLEEMINAGEIKVVGAMYDVGSGRVSLLD